MTSKPEFQTRQGLRPPLASVSILSHLWWKMAFPGWPGQLMWSAQADGSYEHVSLHNAVSQYLLLGRRHPST